MIPKCNRLLKTIEQYVSKRFLICCSGKSFFSFLQKKKKKLSMGHCSHIKSAPIISRKIHHYEYYLYNKINLLGENFVFFAFSDKFHTVWLKNKAAKFGLQNTGSAFCINFKWQYLSNSLALSAQILAENIFWNNLMIPFYVNLCQSNVPLFLSQLINPDHINNTGKV